MAFSFIPANDIGKVRRLIGDTVEAEAECTDEEIQAWLDDEANNHGAAAVKILKSLAAKWAKRASVTTGNEKLELSAVSTAYRQAASDLEESLGTKRVLSNKNTDY